MTTNFKLYLVTWNVANADPPEDFTRLLGLDARVLPNLYAIGLQELKSTPGAFIKDAMYDDPWSKSLMQCLTKRNYVRVKNVRMQGIHLVVYVRRLDLMYLKNIESEFTRAGFNGLWGNKGGVSIRLDISGINVCIVNCHLAAHLPNVQERIADYDAIIDGQKFRDEDTDIIMDHDYVFWMGDLNFRLDDIPRDEVIKRIQESNLESLLPHDQVYVYVINKILSKRVENIVEIFMFKCVFCLCLKLKKAMAEGAILVDFNEGPITFPPSYKYDQNTNQYDSSKKERKPGWCDRIMWLVNKDWFEGVDLEVKQLSYTSIQEYLISDHKPVVSEFLIKVLRNPPELPVMFEPQDTWCMTVTKKCTYTISSDMAVASSDWIGLYQYDFKHPRDYVTYVWGSTKGEDLLDGSTLYTVEFDKTYLRSLDTGMYFLGYFSKQKNCLMGYSDTFHMSTVEESSSDSSDAEASSSSDYMEKYRSQEEAKKKL